MRTTNVSYTSDLRNTMVVKVSAQSVRVRDTPTISVPISLGNRADASGLIAAYAKCYVVDL